MLTPLLLLVLHSYTSVVSMLTLIELVCVCLLELEIAPSRFSGDILNRSTTAPEHMLRCRTNTQAEGDRAKKDENFIKTRSTGRNITAIQCQKS